MILNRTLCLMAVHLVYGKRMVVASQDEETAG
jgi:hypothetical protein